MRTSLIAALLCLSLPAAARHLSATPENLQGVSQTSLQPAGSAQEGPGAVQVRRALEDIGMDVRRKMRDLADDCAAKVRALPADAKKQWCEAQTSRQAGFMNVDATINMLQSQLGRCEEQASAGRESAEQCRERIKRQIQSVQENEERQKDRRDAGKRRCDADADSVAAERCRAIEQMGSAIEAQLSSR